MKQWQSTKLLVNIAHYIDILEPVQILSLALQKKGVDAVNSANSLLKTNSKFHKLDKRPVELYPSIAYLKGNIAENDDRESLFKRLFKINSFGNELLNLNSKKAKELPHVTKAVYNCLENDEEGFLKHVTTILNTERWLKKCLDGSGGIEFADNEVLELYNRFLEPLKIAGFDCTETDLLDEWHKLVSQKLTCIYNFIFKNMVLHMWF